MRAERGEGVDPLPPAVDQLLEGQEQPGADHRGGDDGAGGRLARDDQRGAGADDGDLQRRCAASWRRAASALATARPRSMLSSARAWACRQRAATAGSMPMAVIASALRMAAAVSAWTPPAGEVRPRRRPAREHLGGDRDQRQQQPRRSRPITP